MPLKDPEVRRKYQRELARRDRKDPKKRAKLAAARARWVAKNGQAYRDSKMRSKYGISLAEYEERHRAQRGKCAICRLPERAVDPRTKRVRALAIDHCHRTKRVRGLLCYSCNAGIGLLRENPVALRVAAKYLERA